MLNDFKAYMDKIMPENFVYLPKDVVSGDYAGLIKILKTIYFSV